MALTEDQVKKFADLRDALNIQQDKLSTLCYQLDSIMRVNSYGPYLIDDPSGPMLEAIKISCTEVIEGLQQAMSKL